MTREEEYYCTIRLIYMSIRDFIQWSKTYGLTTELKPLVNRYITMIDSIMNVASQDSFIDKDVCLDLLLYANKFTNYLRSFTDE